MEQRNIEQIDHKNGVNKILVGWIIFFIIERQKILKRKQAGQTPYTEDPIFNEYRFCNVDREDDRVTTWIRDNIRVPYADHKDLWLMLALARWINWPPTLAELVESKYWFGKPDFSLQGLADVMLERQKRGEKIYTGSYMIRAESDKNSPFIDKTKHEFVCLKVIGQLVEDRERIEAVLNKPDCTLQEFNHLITSYVNWGGFMSYELVTDLNHTRYLENASDRYTWLNPGPGFVRGANRLMGLPLNGNLSEKASNEYALQVIEHAHKLYDEGVIPNDLIDKSQIDMRCIESAHCEMDKYLRVLTGEGKPRAKFHSHEQYYNI
ncbi:hypothetical protein SHAb15599_00016 [Acinetobacter phage SH-Ab 15599]|nr:hypothetical protein SHAb15599_00016 [Acinetobacter phage SH-Ab 15599]